MNTVTLASIYELQGLSDEALEIYKNVLKEDPNNRDAKLAIKRLSGNRAKFDGVNIQMRDFFIQMESDVEFLEFERWLVKIWR